MHRNPLAPSIVLYTRYICDLRMCPALDNAIYMTNDMRDIGKCHAGFPKAVAYGRLYNSVPMPTAAGPSCQRLSPAYRCCRNPPKHHDEDKLSLHQLPDIDGFAMDIISQSTLVATDFSSKSLSESHLAKGMHDVHGNSSASDKHVNVA